MRRLRPRRTAYRFRLRTRSRRRSRLVRDLQLALDGLWRRLMEKRDFDQPLGALHWLSDPNTKSVQKHKSERQLNERDRDERCEALSRPDLG